MLLCTFCGKECKNENSQRNHERLCKHNEHRQESSLVKYRKDNPSPWNAGLTKHADDRIYNQAEKESQRRTGKPNNISLQARVKLRELALTNGLGGYQPTGGRGKKGWYRGYWCDSSWELAWVIYHLDHGVSFIKNTKKFPYVFEEKQRNYIPDFYRADLDSFIEVKGYRSVQFDAKVSCFPKTLIVLYENDMDPILGYVVERYGLDFVSLYE